jgi:hypothetical protein
MKATRWKIPHTALAVVALINALGGCGGKTPLDTPVPADAGFGPTPDAYVADVRIEPPDMGIDSPDLGIDRPDMGDVGTDRPDVGTDRPDAVDAGIDRPDVAPDLGIDRHDVAPDVGSGRPDVGDAGIDRPDVAGDSIPRPETGIDLLRDRGSEAGLELLSFVSSVGGTPIRVLKTDRYVFLGDWENAAKPAPGTSSQDGNIQVYDVTDPLVPVLLSTLYTPGDQIQDLAIKDPWLFAANDALGLRLVDISKPQALVSLANRRSDSLDYATSVAVTLRGPTASPQLYAFAGYLYGGGLDIHAVPAGGPIPQPVHYTSTALPSRCDVHQVQVSGDRAYLLASDGETTGYVEILDISQLPAVPTALGRVSLPFASYGGIGDIRSSGDFLYFSASDYTRTPHVGGLRIIDAQDPAKPTLVGGLDLPPSAGSIPWKGTGLAVAGQEVYFITPSGVQVIDVSAPTRPALRFSAPFPPVFGACQGGTAVMEADLLYVGVYCSPSSGGQGGLAIYRRH